MVLDFFTIWIFVFDIPESVIEIFKVFQSLEVVAKREFRRRLLSIVYLMISQNLHFENPA